MDAALPARCGSRRPAAKRTRKSPQSHTIISLRDRRPLSCMSRARFGTTGQGCRRSVVVLLFFAAKYQPSIGCPPRLAGFSIGMRLRKQQRTWLFRAVFERARPAADRKCMAAGDYQFDSEIANVIPILSITSRAAQALGRLFATRLKRRLRVESGPSPRHIKVMGLPPFQIFAPLPWSGEVRSNPGIGSQVEAVRRNSRRTTSRPPRQCSPIRSSA